MDTILKFFILILKFFILILKFYHLTVDNFFKRLLIVYGKKCYEREQEDQLCQGLVSSLLEPLTLATLESFLVEPPGSSCLLYK